jgi:hypothetical protein
MARMPYFVKIFSGKPPTRREIERFYARHEYRVGGSHCYPESRRSKHRSTRYVIA